MRAMLVLAAMACTLTGSACRREHGQPVLGTIFVPAGYFRAGVLCGARFERACKLSYEPPIGKNRNRVLMWLDAFWADAEMVQYADYETCRASGACRGPANRPTPGWANDQPDPCGYNRLAKVSFDDAVAYCQWRGWRLPTPDEFERMGRWTDGRMSAVGDGVRTRDCERRPSPEGIRSLNLTDQWVATAGLPALMGSVYSFRYLEVDPLNFTARFRCVRSAYPTADPGRATVAADQSDPWLQGGPY